MSKHNIKHDPKERDNEFRVIVKQAEREAEQEVAKRFGGKLPAVLGRCHMIWEEQKKILKERYGIDWKTPAEMNPDVEFD